VQEEVLDNPSLVPNYKPISKKIQLTVQEFRAKWKNLKKMQNTKYHNKSEKSCCEQQTKLTIGMPTTLHSPCNLQHCKN